MANETKQGLPIIPFESQAAWEAWLDAHHDTAEGLWIKIAKKASGIESISQSEAVEGAVCYGWIDSQAASFDDDFWLQRFTPRRPNSTWSKQNRQRATELIEQGKMQPTGLAEVERAKQDGRWDEAYDPPSTIAVPDDLRQQLDDHPKAATFFASLDSRNRYAILHRIQTAKKPETRARRIEKYVAMLDAHEAIY